MNKVETTSMSSRGQVVIPQAIRDMLHLDPGEKFIVIGEDDTILLKRLELPSALDALLKKTRALAKEKGITQRDVEDALKRVRKR
jgi:antitoxin PrlF